MRSERDIGTGKEVVGDGRTGDGHIEEKYDEMGTGDLVSALFAQGRHLLQEELRLARIELRREAKLAAASAGVTAGGGVLLHTCLLCFAAFLIGLMSLWLPVWAAALIVTGIFAVVGAAFVFGGIAKLKKVDLKPEETIETLKEDQEWLRKMMHAETSNTRVRA